MANPSSPPAPSADEPDLRAAVGALMRDAVLELDRLLVSELTAEQRGAVQRVRRLADASARLAADGPASSKAAPSVSGDSALAAERPRILLVEDNEVNQRVTRLLLQNRGYAVEVASDGHEAVEAASRTTFAAVLMDCQMPRFDGYAATIEIRHREGLGSRVPIIAMTANAGPGARERCLSAGMDDYVAKPVNAETLDLVLRRWVPRAPPPPAPVPRRPSTPPIDLGMLRKLHTGPPASGRDIVSEVIAIFREDAPLRLAMLREAAARGDWPSAMRAAHTLKGSAGHLGAKALAAVCARFEEKVRRGAPFDVAFTIDAIAEELNRVHVALLDPREEPRSSSASAGGAVSSASPGGAGSSRGKPQSAQTPAAPGSGT
jgi:CheY-like chemotaxis protein